jgi:hypothetical protein
MKTRYTDPLLDRLVHHGVAREQLAVEWVANAYPHGRKTNTAKELHEAVPREIQDCFHFLEVSNGCGAVSLLDTVLLFRSR